MQRFNQDLLEIIFYSRTGHDWEQIFTLLLTALIFKPINYYFDSSK